MLYTVLLVFLVSVLTLMVAMPLTIIIARLKKFLAQHLGRFAIDQSCAVRGFNRLCLANHSLQEQRLARLVGKVRSAH